VVLGLDVVEGIASLLDNSLLVRDDSSGEPRITMLETVREFASEQSRAHGEAAGYARHHAQYCLTLVERAEPYLLGGDQLRWLDVLDAELDNLRAALHWCLTACKDADGTPADLGIRLAGALWWYWFLRGHFHEGRRYLESALERAGSGPNDARVKALHGAALLTHNQGDIAVAGDVAKRSLDLARASGDARALAWGLGLLGVVVRSQGAYPRSLQLAEQSLAHFREADDSWGIAAGHFWLGTEARVRGEPERAAQRYEESLRSFRATGDRFGITIVLYFLGRLRLELGDHRMAAAHHAESVALAREARLERSASRALYGLGLVARSRGDDAQAVTLLQESLASHRDLGDLGGIAQCADALVGIAARTCDARFAARLLGIADAARTALDTPRPAAEQRAFDRDVDELRGRLGDPALQAAWATGLTLPRERAIDELLRSDALAALAAPRGRPSAEDLGGLTPRERQVVALIGRGCTNREIADGLKISEKTAEVHARNIREKLGLATRTEMAAWAARRNLVPDEF
jgi:DNA-binding CsgD family transcriptional regulator/tetratricopeptide (TPR) repeat protein